jgi:hypothetical protein
VFAKQPITFLNQNYLLDMIKKAAQGHGITSVDKDVLEYITLVAEV